MHPSIAMGLCVRGGCKASYRFESPMEMKWAHFRLLCQLLQRWRLLGPLDQTARICDFGEINCAQAHLIRLAAFARSKSRFLCVLASQMVLHVLGTSEASSARRSAIHTCRFDRIEELAI